MFFTNKLNLHLNCVLMLNWIVWNRTIFIKMDMVLNNLQRLICHKIQTTKQSSILIKRIYIWLNSFKYSYLILISHLIIILLDITITVIWYQAFLSNADHFQQIYSSHTWNPNSYLAQSAGAIKYTDCFSAKE